MKLAPHSQALAILLAGTLFAGTATAGTGQRPDALDGIDIEQKLGAQVPLDAVFRDEIGREVSLADVLGEKPTVLALVYYECPMLCSLVLNGLLKALRVLKFDVGDQFNIVTVSFNERETPALAMAKKTTHLKEYGREGAGDGWQFLTGDEKSIRALTDSVGFEYRWDENTQQYAHATALILLTPSGKVARYFYGVEYSPRDMRLAIVEAADEKIGSLTDKVLLYCYQYDPTTGKYGLVIMNVLRVAGGITVLALGGFMLLSLRRDRRSSSTPPPDTTA